MLQAQTDDEFKPISPYGEERRLPIKKLRAGKITISTTIGVELHKQAQENGVSWAEALRRGITLILSEKTDDLYQNPMQQRIKIEALVARLEEVSQKYNELKDKEVQ